MSLLGRHADGQSVASHLFVPDTRPDNIGKDGLKATEATVTRVDRGAKILAVKTADGTEETYRLTDSAAKDAGKDVGEGTEKSEKVTVYYAEESGRRVAHFFKQVV